MGKTDLTGPSKEAGATTATGISVVAPPATVESQRESARGQYETFKTLDHVGVLYSKPDYLVKSFVAHLTWTSSNTRHCDSLLESLVSPPWGVV
jgi:uncharacterized membrane protein